MRPTCHLLLVLSVLLLWTAPLSAQFSRCTVTEAASMPDGGTAGAFCGVVGSACWVAGGSDFPGLKPWEGGTKVWSDRIRTITEADGRLTVRTLPDVRLPYPVGNGCSACNGKVLWCIGGITPDGPTQDILALQPNDGNCQVSRIGSLPAGFRPNAAVHHKGYIYVCGVRDGANAWIRIQASTLQVKELTPAPGPVMEEGSVLVVQHDGREEAIYLIGGRGRDGDGLHIASRVLSYLPGQDCWREKTPFREGEKALSLMYAPAIAYGSAHILVFGGDDGVEFKKRDSLAADPDKAEALKTAFETHPGFQKHIFAYHTITDTWTSLAEVPESLPAVTTAVKLGDRILLPSGEVHPGIRSTGVLSIRIDDGVSFGWVNYLIIILYLLIMMGVGFYFSRRNNGSEVFFKGGGQVPWWAAGISIFATALSAITFLSIPAKAYATDWGMFLFNMMIITVVPVIIHFYLPLFRKLKVASVYEYLENRFDGSVRSLASAFFCVFMFARIAIVLFLPSLALHAVTGINIYLCILLMGVVTLAYCTMGGIEAVIWGDVIQGILLVGGALISLFWILGGIDGGIGTWYHTAVLDRKFHIFNFKWDWTQPVFWVAVIGGFSNSFLTYTSDQSVVQKYLTVKDNRSTGRGLWLNGILTIPITLLFFGIGTALYVFFKQRPELLSVGMSNTDSIFPHYIMCQLPTGVSGLLIAAVFAAAMSTLSSNINSSTTVLTEDFYARFKKGVTDRQKVRFARISGILAGSLGITMALTLATFDIASLWDQFNFFLGLLTSGLGGLFLMGIAAPRIGPRAAWAGFIGSVLTLLAIHVLTPASPILYGFLGLSSCFILGWLFSFLLGYGK